MYTFSKAVNTCETIPCCATFEPILSLKCLYNRFMSIVKVFLLIPFFLKNCFF